MNECKKPLYCLWKKIETFKRFSTAPWTLYKNGIVKNIGIIGAVARYFVTIREEELKNLVKEDWFSEFLIK